MLHRCLLAVSAVTLFYAGIAPAPPVPKKDELPPITEKMLEKGLVRMKYLGLAVDKYEAVHQTIPTNQRDAKGKELLSWRVQILPYIKEEALYKEFKMDEPWDSDHNKPLIAKMPEIYKPLRAKAAEGHTFAQGFRGDGGLIRPKAKPYSIAEIPDGSSNTILFTEAAAGVIWTKPDDMEVDPKKAFPALGGEFDGQFFVAMADGSAFRFKSRPPEKILRVMARPDDGLVVDWDEYKAKESNKP